MILGKYNLLAAEAAATAYDIRWNCNMHDYVPSGAEDKSSPLFVAVSYNRAAFTAVLMVEDCDIYEDLRTFHNTTLGSDNGISAEEQYTMMRSGLEAVMKPPYPKSMYTSTKIWDVILLGEMTNDPVLHSVLEDVLAYALIDHELAIEIKDAKAVSPLFAAARGAAKGCLG
ncbi:hypothetical protein E4T47_01867 [Aureobasidium subglaciale]|nr:hypothetical protein E4T47_01867 [Aureobasidium subglaciale]